MTTLDDDKPMWGLGEVLKLSWPASLTMLSSTLMQFVDAWMVSFTGPVALGAQFVGGIASFVPASIGLGTLTVVNTYVSQNLGANRCKRCGQYAWAGLTIALLCSVLAIPLVIWAGPLFALFNHTSEVWSLETMYFRYLTSAMIFFLAGRALEQFFFGLHRPGIVLLGALAANLFNVGCNYVLIFGKLGFPAMGLEGAAIGTVLGNVLLLAVLGSAYLSRSMHTRYATRLVRAMKLSQCAELLRVGWPAGVQFCNDVLSWNVFVAVLVGRFGTIHLAASTAAMRFMSLSFMPAVGVGVATTALVGRHIGHGRPDIARRRAHAAALAAMAYMTACATAFLVFRHEMVGLFANIPHSPDISAAEARALTDKMVAIGGWVMICAAVFQTFDALGIVFMGALRGAGDTFWPMILSAGFSWLLTAGGGAAMVFLVPQLESVGPWMAASAYVIVLGIVLAWRFETGRWRKIDLLGTAAAPVPAGESLQASIAGGLAPDTPANPEAFSAVDDEPHDEHSDTD